MRSHRLRAKTLVDDPEPAAADEHRTASAALVRLARSSCRAPKSQPAAGPAAGASGPGSGRWSTPASGRRCSGRGSAACRSPLRVTCPPPSMIVIGLVLTTLAVLRHHDHDRVRAAVERDQAARTDGADDRPRGARRRSPRADHPVARGLGRGRDIGRCRRTAGPRTAPERAASALSQDRNRTFIDTSPASQAFARSARSLARLSDRGDAEGDDDDSRARTRSGSPGPTRCGGRR